MTTTITARIFFHEGRRDRGDLVRSIQCEGPDDWTLLTDHGEYLCTPLVAAALRRDRGDLAEAVSRQQCQGDRYGVDFSTSSYTDLRAAVVAARTEARRELGEGFDVDEIGDGTTTIYDYLEPWAQRAYDAGEIDEYDLSTW